jgi:hypothetical protein
MAVEVTSRVDNPGMWFGRYGIKRGDVFEVPSQYHAEKLAAQGRADIGRVPLDRLGKPGDGNPEALKRFLKDTAAKMPEESKPFPPDHPSQRTIGARYQHSYAREGWGV